MPGFFRKKEPIYTHVKNSKPKRFFDHMKAQEADERDQYIRYLKSKNLVDRCGQSKFDSLQLLGANDDIDYLDTFMSVPRQRRRRSVCDENDVVNMHPQSLHKSATTMTLNKSKSKASLPSTQSAASLAMLDSLKSSNSEDKIYESLEMIHYLKTKKNLDRQMKTRSVQKTGHPLFDHLREEQALKCNPKEAKPRSKRTDRALQPTRSRENSYPTMNFSFSPPHSSSSSGDEYETVTFRTIPRQKVDPEKENARQDNFSGDSDDDWAIPRPLFMRGFPKRNRKKKSSTGTDDSDTSTKSSGGLR